MTGYGKTCSDVSLHTIVDEGECKTAAEDLDLVIFYYGNEINSNYPPGCYVEEVTGFLVVNFNEHDSGTGNQYAKSICKGVYQFINNQSLSKIKFICNMNFHYSISVNFFMHFRITSLEEKWRRIQIVT